ncbi:MAG: hypothetical protein ACXV3A_12790 [Kineosporiaceae bacterium]
MISGCRALPPSCPGSRTTTAPASDRARAGPELGLVVLLPVVLVTKDRPDVRAAVTPAEDADDVCEGDAGDGGDGEGGDGEGGGDGDGGDVADGAEGPLVVTPSPPPDGLDPHAETDTTRVSAAMATAIGLPVGGR